MQVQIRIKPDVVEQMDKVAQDDGRNRSDWIRRQITKGIEAAKKASK